MYDEEQLGQDIFTDLRGVGTAGIQLAGRILDWLVKLLNHGMIVGSRKLMEVAHKRHIEHILDGRMSVKQMQRMSIEKDWPTKTVRHLSPEQYSALAARFEHDKTAFALEKGKDGEVNGLQYFTRDTEKISGDIEDVTKMNATQATADLQNTEKKIDQDDRKIFYKPAKLEPTITKLESKNLGPTKLDTELRKNGLKIETMEDVGHDREGAITHLKGGKLVNFVVAHANDDALPLTAEETRTADRVCESLSRNLDRTVEQQAVREDKPVKAQDLSGHVVPDALKSSDATQQIPVQRKHSLKDIRASIGRDATKISKTHALKPKSVRLHHENVLK